MKKSLFLSLFIFGIPLRCESEHATPGAITEALFIIENKQCELQERVQELKKSLTECLLISKNEKRKMTRVMKYHCSLKEILYPWIIKELETLIAQIGIDTQSLLQEKPVTAKEVTSAVDRAFHSKEKMALERELIELIFAIDVKTAQLRSQEQRTYRQMRKEPNRPTTIKALKYEIEQSTQKMHTLREFIFKVNTDLYQQLKNGDRLFLENLACFKFPSR